MQEIFKDIPDYEGLYQVSNLGNVKSLSRHYLKKGKYPSISKEKILKYNIMSSGYYSLSLYKEGKGKSIKIHQLVAMAFLNHKPNGYKIVVDHINNNKLDNRLENLQIISNRENASKNTKKKSSIYTGVFFRQPQKKFTALIRINNKLINLGSYSNELEAHETYQNALKMYNNGDLSFIKSRKTSQFKGVCWDKHKCKWKACIIINKKCKHLGNFNNEIDAHQCYQNAYTKLKNS
jgi:hypothetical protein